MFTAENWPIGANMLGFGNKAPDGTPVLEAPSTVWASQLRQVKELGVDQNELSQHLVRRAQQSGQDPQEFANHMFEHNHVPELVQEILRGKALATIVESATVKDASGNVVELKNLRPDGTIGEPEAEEADVTEADEKADDEA